MKKNLFSRLVLMTTLIALVSACSKKSEYTDIIPSDASEVFVFHLKPLADKAGMNDKENQDALHKFTDAIKSSMNAATFQEFEKIMQDPQKSGIDFKEPIYLFNAPSFPYLTTVAKVSSEDDLHALQETLEREQICQHLMEGNGYQYTSINNQILLAFNSTVALCVSYQGNSQLEQIKQSIPTLLKQTKENSINSTSVFKKMQKMNGDIGILVSQESLLGAYAKQINYGLTEEVTLKDLSILASISFEKGKISMKCDTYTENATTQALLDKQQKAVRPIENTFLKQFPQSTLMLLSLGVNGKELYNILQENEEFRANFSIAKADEVKELFSTFQNDITAGLINFTMDSAPTFLLYADVKSTAPVNLLYDKKGDLGLKRGEDILKLDEDKYVYKSKNINLFFGIHDKKLYATNDELLYKSINKPMKPSAKETEYASGMKGQNFAFIIHIESILQLPFMKMMVEYGGPEHNMFYTLANKTTYMEVIGVDGKAELTLYLKDKNVNALKQMTDFVREFAGF